MEVRGISYSPEQTQSVGRAMGVHAQSGHVFLLTGELGAGKTCLTQGLLWGLGADDYARSPSFVLVSQYHDGRLTLYHIDLYRLSVPEEAFELGLDEYLYGDGVCVIEWANRVPGLFSEKHLDVRIDRLGESTRRLMMSTEDSKYSSVLSAVRSNVR